LDTAWIQVFVLTFAECVAPAGKTVCQQNDFEMTFVSRSDCEIALQQLMNAKDALPTVIVNKAASKCVATALEQEIFASPYDVAGTVTDDTAWRAPDTGEAASTSSSKQHQSRLQSLPTCEASKGVAPCKIGEIIIEDETGSEPVELWRREKQ
jgi:hypothetical protein